MSAVISQSLLQMRERRRVLLVLSTASVRFGSVIPDINVTRSENISVAEWRHEQAEGQDPSIEMVLGIGGGRVMDAAKLRGAQLGVPVTLVPTVLSTDAFLTASAAVRDEGKVRYVPTLTVERVVIDEALVQSAPAWMNALGCCDVLSILTAELASRLKALGLLRSREEFVLPEEVSNVGS